MRLHQFHFGISIRGCVQYTSFKARYKYIQKEYTALKKVFHLKYYKKAANIFF